MIKMMKNLLQANPFPPPEYAGEEIIQIGLMFGCMTVIIFLMLLMIYAYRKLQILPVIITIYSFSLVIGMICIGSNVYTPFEPYCGIFFLVFQTSMFITIALEMKEKMRFK